MDDIARQLDARDRLRRRMEHAMTPRERIARGRAMHERGLRMLAANPEAFARFLARNLRERAARTQTRV